MHPAALSRRSFLVGTASIPLAAGGLRAVAHVPSLDGEDDPPAPGSSAAMVLACLERIRTLDSQGPSLRSVVELNPEAPALARRRDRDEGSPGLLQGLPILVKDNLDTCDRMRTTAGSLAMVDAPTPKRDSEVVRRLRTSGAVLLGKTNLSEWANFRGNRSTSGWSGRGGQTRNPHALDRSPSGSSSGSAVAVAAELCAMAVGTETDGSITSPAAACGIVGLKPTVGLVSRRGIIPISHSQDTAGPMARSVKEVALLLGAMAGPDPEDEATAHQPSRLPDFLGALDPEGLKGTRLGVLQDHVGAHAGVDRVMSQAWEDLKGAGATLVPVTLPTTAFEAAEFEVLLHEFKAGLEAYLQGRSCAIRTLKELIDFNEAHSREELRLFGQELVVQAAAKGGLQDPGYRSALALCRKASREEGIDALLKAHRLDALIGPTGTPAWMIDPINGDAFGFSCTSAPAVAGYPHLTVPAGEVLGLPVGLSFIGTAWQESALLRLGYAYEQRTHRLKKPEFLPTSRL